MSSGEEAVLQGQRQALARRFFARVFFSWLLGLSVPIFGFVFDLTLSPSQQFSSLLARSVIAPLALVMIVNSVSIGIVTYTAHISKSARPRWWALPASLGVLAGLLLMAFHLTGVTPLYQNAVEAFVVGAVAGVAVGTAYTLSIPGMRQDTILKQSRRSIIISGVIGIQYGVYFLVKELPQNASDALLIYYVVEAIIGVPISIMGMLLSFVLGIELGDRYIERE